MWQSATLGWLRFLLQRQLMCCSINVLMPLVLSFLLLRALRRCGTKHCGD